MKLSVTKNGLEVPEKYQNENKIVIRTPYNTANISQGFSVMVTNGKISLVKPDMFTHDENTETDIENEALLPNQVQFKPHGKEAETYTVTVQAE